MQRFLIIFFILLEQLVIKKGFLQFGYFRTDDWFCVEDFFAGDEYGLM
jgi:hypothetical protein